MPILGVAGDLKPRAKKKQQAVRDPAVRHARNVRKRLRNQARRAEKAAKLKAKTEKHQRKAPTVVTRRTDGIGRLRYWQLYALELSDGCYYVGVTAYSDPMHRFNQHVAGKGAKWTKLHKPIRIIETRPLGECYESVAVTHETELTVEYMLAYGSDKVRGGDLVLLNPQKTDRAFRAHLRRKLTELKVA